MNRELIFFGNKRVLIDEELCKEYEMYFHPFSERTVNYFSLVFDLNEDMTEEEITDKLTKEMKRDIIESKRVAKFFSRPDSIDKINQLINGDISEISIADIDVEE